MTRLATTSTGAVQASARSIRSPARPRQQWIAMPSHSSGASSNAGRVTPKCVCSVCGGSHWKSANNAAAATSTAPAKPNVFPFFAANIHSDPPIASGNR